MKRVYIIFATVFSLLVLSTQPANAQLLKGLLRLCGVSDDSPWMAVAEVGDGIINATSAKTADSVIGTYGQDAENNYNQYVKGYNERKNNEREQYLSEVDQYKMEYCKSHGFYDTWVEQYGEEWFEKAGRSWFDRRDAEIQRRAEARERIIEGCMNKPEDQWTWYERSVVSEGAGESSLLPIGMGGNVNEETRYNQLNDFRTTVLGAVGLSMDDVDRANKWVSGDKYDKQDMIVSAATNVVSNFTPSHADLVNSLGELIKVNNQYNKEKGGDKPAAISKRSIDLANIVFDAAWEKNENRKRYIANNLNLSDVLFDAGIDENRVDANDLAGVVLSIQNNELLTQEEKNQWYQDLGIKNYEQTVAQAVKNVNSMTDQQVAQSLKPVNEGPSPEEIRTREAAEAEARAKAEKDAAISTVKSAHLDSYKFDSTELNNEQKATLDRITVVLNQYPDLNLQIKGHTCDIGTNSVNDRVGLRRAEAAKAYLIDKGIAANRISTVSGGENEPVVENNSADNRKQNRRLTFEIN